MNKDLFDQIWYGGDYNPEQWKEEVWAEDMRIFRKANINTASINVFSWASLQPSENEYDFTTLDKIVDMLTEENYNIIMGTSTASLPAWLCMKYPDVTRVDYEGRKHGFGHRHNHCPNSQSFNFFAKRLVDKIAERYAHHLNIKMWHISNEYSGECYCENCAKAFRVWVKDKYQTEDAVNEAWSMSFWGHTLYSFEEIIPPNHLGDGSSDMGSAFAGLSIDYRRFNSDSLLNNFKMEKKVIHKHNPKAVVTTNLMGAYKSLDYFKWAKEMDIVSWDNYPAHDTSLSHTSMNHDLMRGLKDGQSFMLMEQTPSQQNWQPYNALKRPGKMRVQSYQSIAHGADTIQFFQLRRSKGAVEKFHGAVIEHVGHEDTRVFREVAELGKELSALGDTLIGTETKAKVGILFDWDNYWALEYTSGPSVDLRYVDQIQRFYDACYEQQISVDMIHMASAFEKYDVILAPVLYMVKDGVADKIEEYTKQGGTFVTTYMSGIVNQSDNVHLDGYPGPLRELLGIWVEEIDALDPKIKNEIKPKVDFFENNEYSSNMLFELMHTEGAEVIAEYGTDFYAGMPAITKNTFGKGESWYIGTVLEQEMLNELIKYILKENDITGFGELPEGVEITTRVKDDRKYIFVMNHTDEEQTITVPFKNKFDLLTDEDSQTEMNLKPYDVKIFTKKEEAVVD